MDPTPRQDLTDTVLDLVLTKYEAPAGATAQTPFEALDFDSLVLVELAVKLTNLYDVKISDEELREAGTVAATVELLLARGVRT